MSKLADLPLKARTWASVLLVIAGAAGIKCAEWSGLFTWRQPRVSAEVAHAPDAKPKELETPDLLRVSGVTEPATGRFAQLSLATAQPVAFVDVRPGDHVKKGWQVFSHWESPEGLQAVKKEIDRAQRMLVAARARHESALATHQRLRRSGAGRFGEALQDAQASVDVLAAEVDAAQATCEVMRRKYAAAEFDFSQAFVKSPIDGVVAAVAVVPGERRQLNPTFRGVTVLDPSVLQCRCLLTAAHLRKLDRLQSLQQTGVTARASTAALAGSLGLGPLNAAVLCRGTKVHEGLTVTVETPDGNRPATIVSIGIRAEEPSGQFPVLLEVDNADERLRCGVGVDVSFRCK